MAAKYRESHWKAEVVGRYYRNVHLWIEETRTHAPAFDWYCQCGAEGAAMTIEAAKVRSTAHVRKAHRP